MKKYELNKEIVKGNELIAAFMGLKSATKRQTAINPENGKAMKCSEDVKCYFFNREWIRGSELNYHLHWGRLMPVLERIEGKQGVATYLDKDKITIGGVIAYKCEELVRFRAYYYIHWTKNMSKRDALWACIVKYLE